MIAADSTADRPWSFPLFEVMIVVAIAGILAPLAQPNMMDLLHGMQSSTMLMDSGVPRMAQMVLEAQTAPCLEDSFSLPSFASPEERRTILQ